MRTIWIIIAVILALVVWRGVEFMQAAGFFRPLAARPLACVSVGGVIGPEDVTIDPERKIAWLSGYDRRGAAAGKPGPGAIWSYDLSNTQGVPVNATPWADEKFQPHGISLNVTKDGIRRLFVINHGGGVHTIEVLEERGGSLARMKTIRDDALRSPNDLAAIDGERFYVTNDHRFEKGVLRSAEDFLGLPLTNVLYHDGSSFREVASGLTGANGIHISKDGLTVFVSAARGEKIHVYDRDPATGDLTPRKRITMPGMPDNIEPAPDGSLLVAVHPKPLKLLTHVRESGKHAPSHVVRVEPVGGAVTTLYLDASGEELSGASTAALQDGRLLIGSIAEPKFLDCVID